MLPAWITPNLVAHLVLIFIIFNVLVLASAFMVWLVPVIVRRTR